MTTSNDDRFVEIEVKLAYQAEAIEQLSATLVDKEKRITSLEESVKRLERALEIVARRAGDGGGEVAGAHPEDDPVPRSG